MFNKSKGKSGFKGSVTPKANYVSIGGAWAKENDYGTSYSIKSSDKAKIWIQTSDMSEPIEVTWINMNPNKYKEAGDKKPDYTLTVKVE